MRLTGILFFAVFSFSGDTVDDNPEVVLQAFFKAFNAHDVKAMTALVHEDLAWLSLVDNEVRVETLGRAALEKSMSGYFKAIPSTGSEIVSSMAAGPFVTVRERASWTDKNGRQSQDALAVYEIREGKILRVWYYPAM